MEPSVATSPPWPHARFPTDTLMRTRHSQVMDNTLGLPGDTDGLHKSFFDANMNKHISVLYFQRVLHSIEFFKKMHPKKYRYIGCVLMHNCLNHCN